jgi:hypothetical protein
VLVARGLELPRRGGRWTVALAAVACALLLSARPAAGAEATPTPSARELWDTYPLNPRLAAPARSAPTPERRTRVVAERSDEPETPAGLLWPAIAVLLALGAGMLLWTSGVRARMKARAGRDDSVAPAATPARQPREAPARRLHAIAGGPMPPEPRGAWHAEVEWRMEGGSAIFAAVARSPGASRPVVVARSPALRWPPVEQAAVAALGDAVDELERSLLVAGWTSRPAGAEWYAKRFAWSPRPAAVDAAGPAPGPHGTQERTRRFRRAQPWPQGSDLRWRCEVRWKPGLVNSRFEAEARGPGSEGQRTVGASATFRWLMMADPDPTVTEYHDALALLSARIEAAGWERIGRGRKWYSQRYIWPRAGAPPESPASVGGSRTGAA